MDVVKLPKKVRMVCYEIMDGKAGALDTLRLPFHQNEFLEQNPRPGIPGFPNRSGVGPSARGVLWV